jgi:hypothetical protein
MKASGGWGLSVPISRQMVASSSCTVVSGFELFLSFVHVYLSFAGGLGRRDDFLETFGF